MDYFQEYLLDLNEDERKNFFMGILALYDSSAITHDEMKNIRKKYFKNVEN